MNTHAKLLIKLAQYTVLDSDDEPRRQKAFAWLKRVAEREEEYRAQIKSTITLLKSMSPADRGFCERAAIRERLLALCEAVKETP